MEKQYEFQKSRLKDGVDRIIFYASSPQKEVVGEAAMKIEYGRKGCLLR